MVVRCKLVYLSACKLECLLDVCECVDMRDDDIHPPVVVIVVVVSM